LKKLGVRTIAADYAEHGARGAMSRITGATEFALAAACVNFADHAPADEFAIRALFDDADKLVSDRAIETGIAARDLEIGVADA
jgi:hypothetical protein